MALEGQLSDFGLADLCQLLSMGRKTGCLTVTRQANFGYIYLEDGRVLYATVLNRPDRLGDVLVRNGLITRDELRAAVRDQASHPDRRIGRILVERGSLPETELRRFVSQQIEESVYHLFTWDEGTFHFEPDRRPEVADGMLVSIPVENLLLEGARRVDELSVIRERIPSGDLVFATSTSAGVVELAPSQIRLLGLLDGQRTVDELIEESGLGEFNVLQSLFGLLQAGQIQSAGQKDPVDGVAAGTSWTQRIELAHAYYRAGMLEDAEAEYLAGLELGGNLPLVWFRLGSIALRSGRPADAVDRFENVAKEAGRDDQRAAGLMNLALALEGLEHHSEALDALERVDELVPDHGACRLARAILLLKSGDALRASELFSEIREDSGGETPPEPHFFAYAILARAGAGDVEGALELGHEGLAHYPESTPILVHLGLILEHAGDPRAAEGLYLRATGKRHPLPEAHRNIGDLALARGDSAGARAHYERAVKLAPDRGPDLHIRLGNLAYEEGDRVWARRHWERALELDPENDTIRSNLELVPAPAEA